MNQQLTNEQLKEKIITEFYQTGRIDGYYFGRKSSNKNNPVKEYINNCLYKSFLLQNTGVQKNDFISDIYQEGFLHLWNYDTDRFIEMYNSSKIKGNKIIALLLRMIILKCFSRDKRNNNPKHSLVSRLGFGSVYNASNFQIIPLENNDIDSTEPTLILFDVDEETEFKHEYGFTPEELIGQLSPEAQFVFYKLLGKQKTGAPSKERIIEKQQLTNDIKAIKNKIEKEKGIGDE